ncbi:O-antigen translocase [Flavobacterium aciduliphilum]|uniref:PST family polysaccharide transporter n=1 Tax=Flavobacterium aciduliphilum TaxID=1101402 RepID=A0A328YXQ1_9FLAO|nr:O-antigen translocase [Flavobacterium aciduliphilum]RAR75327.1 PST family polysaccharide transporter [Flavobacterium aciduliphilum]
MIQKIKNNPLIKVLSINSISVAVSFVLGLFSSKVISVFLGTSGMALIGSFRNFTSMLKSIATLGISNSVVKLFVEHKEDEEKLASIYATFFGLFLIISLALGTLLLLFADPISTFIFFKNSYSIPIQFFGLSLPLVVMNVFWTAIYNAFEQFKFIVIIQIISNILLFAITAYLIWKENLFGGLLSVAIGDVISFIITYIFIKNSFGYFKFSIQKMAVGKYFNVLKKFSIMAFLSAVLVPITLILIRNKITALYSTEEAGIWEGINRLSGFYMMFFNTGLTLYYAPKLASLTTDNEFRNELKEYFKHLVPIFIVVLLIVFFFKGFIVELAFTKEFNKIKNILVWQLLGDLFRFFSLAFGFQIVMKSMMKRYFIVEIVFNTTFLLLSFLLLPNYATLGVLQAYFLSSFGTFLIMIYMFRKVLIKM